MLKPNKSPSTPDEAVWTMSVPDAGRKYLGLGKQASYAAAKAGIIPVVVVGRFVKALPRQLEKQLAGEN
jgi:hypothetical protein